jgi:4-amino-4-deoxy-L-arabinose transferase-like glycosyltransferase
VHVAAGYEWLIDGTYTADRQHPPLARVLFALPAIGTGLPVTHDPIETGNSIYYRDAHYVRNLAATRAPNLLFLLLALIAAALWARKLAGDTAAILTLAILGALPPLLGHAGFATTDVPVTAMIALALYAFDEWQLRPTWRNALLTALCIGIGVLTKMSFLTLFTVGALVLIRRRPRIAQCAAMTLIVVFLVWAGHRFSTGHLNDYRLTTFEQTAAEYQAAKYATAPGYGWVRADIVKRYWRYAYDVGHGRMTGIDFVDWARAAGYPSPVAGRRGDTMRGWPPVPPPDALAKVCEPFRAAYQWVAVHVTIPAPEFVVGMECVRDHVYNGHAGYLFGRISEKGWWYYFPVILFFKTPVALLILAVIGFRFMPRYALIPMAMLAMAMTTAINIGVRHILPLYPFLAVAAAIAVLHLKRPVAIALCGWYVIATTFAHPDYMAYFNEFAFGHPERIASDSNLDWGQDLLRLGAYGKTHHIDYVDYFGTADWRSQVPGALQMPDDHPVHGWIAVSDMWRHFGGASRHGVPWLQPYAPVDRVGASIWIYHIP